MTTNPTAGKSKNAIWSVLGFTVVLMLLGVAVYQFSKPHPNPNPRSQRIAINLESAILYFNTEYERLPVTNGVVRTDTPEGLHLLEILLGLETETVPQNPRGLKFLVVPEARDRKGGLLYSKEGNSVEGLYDSWGNPFTVILDTDHDEILHFNFGAKPIELKSRRVAVFSPGPDHQESTDDDVNTW